MLTSFGRVVVTSPQLGWSAREVEARPRGEEVLRWQFLTWLRVNRGRINLSIFIMEEMRLRAWFGHRFIFVLVPTENYVQKSRFGSCVCVGLSQNVIVACILGLYTGSGKCYSP